MLSELQTLLTQQKRARESFEQQLEDEKAERKKLQTALQVKCREMDESVWFPTAGLIAYFNTDDWLFVSSFE